MRTGRRAGQRRRRRSTRSVASLAGQMRALLSLCHPDKHSNSQLATTTTQWLLALRDRLEHAPRENVR